MKVPYNWQDDAFYRVPIEPEAPLEELVDELRRMIAEDCLD